MKVETGVAEVLEPFAKLIQVAGAATKRHGDLHAFAKVEPFEAALRRELRMSVAIVPYDPLEIISQSGNRSVITNVERRELLSQVAPVRRGERPLREVVGKTFRKEVMGSKCLEGVMKNRSVAAVFEAGQQFRESSSGLVFDARKVGGGYEVKGCFGDVQFL